MMSGRPGSTFNTIKIKEEIVDDDDMVQCKICYKMFASDLALRNHARMEHIDAYASGDPSQWTEEKVTAYDFKSARNKMNEETIKIKTEAILNSMEHTSLISLASNDVSYIIIKSDEGSAPKRKRSERKEREDKVVVRKEKETQAITGPFECLQPSTVGGDGTCHQIFFSCCEYSTHFRDEHTRRRKGLRCQVCEKPLACLGDAPAAPYNCDVCGEGFISCKDLSDHTAIAHVKLKPYECNVCHKRFTQQGGVLQHMRMHTGDRPFACTFCPKAFTQKSGLDQHLRIHTKVKPYRCIVCSKTFCQSVHLKQHMRTHTNVAPFQCGICEKRFKQSSHLNYHLKNHNTATMTEEQKAKYAELVGLINKEIVEVEIDQTQSELEVEHEQILAEKSIICEKNYDMGEEESWCVEITESET